MSNRVSIRGGGRGRKGKGKKPSGREKRRCLLARKMSFRGLGKGCGCTTSFVSSLSQAHHICNVFRVYVCFLRRKRCSPLPPSPQRLSFTWSHTVLFLCVCVAECGMKMCPVAPSVCLFVWPVQQGGPYSSSFLFLAILLLFTVNLTFLFCRSPFRQRAPALDGPKIVGHAARCCSLSSAAGQIW